MRRLDIGIASYRNPARLRATLESLAHQSTTDWRCYVIDNPSSQDSVEDVKNINVVFRWAEQHGRFAVIRMDKNVGYAGAVNELFRRAETEYIAYLDNDVDIRTPGWDERLASYLDRFHEIGMAFPNGGAYQINRGSYNEILWGVGCCWMVNRLAMADTGPFDETLGHQEEADYCQRVRMAGWKCASAPDVHIHHDAHATNNPASIERINRGVVNWVNKWNRYFNGKNFNYHSPNVTRFEDWPPNALYLEEWWKLQKPQQSGVEIDLSRLNDSPQVITVHGSEYDLIRVPRFKEFYRGRVI